jgi:RNA polymerase sigma factor (sigma-70 family)
MEDIFHIITGCTRQDRQCQKALYEQCFGFCFRIAFRYVKTYEQATEVTHDAFLRIFRNVGRFEIRSSRNVGKMLMGWIKRIVINAAIDYMRKESTWSNCCPLQVYIPDQFEEGNTSDSPVLYKELIALVRGLPPAYQLTFNLHVIEGYSHPEIATMLGIATGTSKSNLAKARAILRKSIQSSTMTANQLYRNALSAKHTRSWKML